MAGRSKQNSDTLGSGASEQDPGRPLSHVGPDGSARMVDVSDKSISVREALAAGTIRIAPQAMQTVREGRSAKGNVVETARLAGILAAKRTSELIPLCHPLPIEHVSVDIEESPRTEGFEIRARVRSRGRTGVEMEALTAVSVAALTIYDMVKAADKTMVIGDIRLLRKQGGRSGLYERKEESE